MSGELERGMAEHYRRFLRRLGAQRAEVRTPGGRDRLRTLRKAALPPQTERRQLMPTDRQLAVAGLILLLFTLAIVVGEADGATRQQTKAAICQVFGPRCAQALEVARCETGGSFYPRSVGDAGERGLFQIHPTHFGWLNESRLFEPFYNARAAYRLSRGGRDWGHWTCRP